LSTYQVTIVSHVNVSATCQFVVVLFIFVQFSLDIRYFCLIQFLYLLFLFNLVSIFVKMEQFFPFQVETKFKFLLILYIYF